MKHLQKHREMHTAISGALVTIFTLGYLGTFAIILGCAVAILLYESEK